MKIAFIGGGNMASAIMAGLCKQGQSAADILVLEPYAPQREKLLQDFAGLQVLEQVDARLAAAELVVWAIKPQIFKEVAQTVKAHTSQALHLSVAAGIHSDSIARWLGSERVVRAMPNTPALVGQGISGLFARAQVTQPERQLIEQTLQATGQFLWVAQEADLNAVTALSGSGPAYVFYFLEAMVQAGVDMGLSPEQAHQLAIGTFTGASQLAAQSSESPAVLRERVTSKGGTTYAALESMRGAQLGQHFIPAMNAAEKRATELGDEFGK